RIEATERKAIPGEVAHEDHRVVGVDASVAGHIAAPEGSFTLRDDANFALDLCAMRVVAHFHCDGVHTRGAVQVHASAASDRGALEEGSGRGRGAIAPIDLRG